MTKCGAIRKMIHLRWLPMGPNIWLKLKHVIANLRQVWLQEASNLRDGLPLHLALLS